MKKKIKKFLDSCEIKNTLIGDKLTVFIDDKSYTLSVFGSDSIIIREEVRWALKNFNQSDVNIPYNFKMYNNSFYGIVEWITDFHNIYTIALDKSNESYLQSMELVSNLNADNHLTHSYDDYDNIHVLKNSEESNIHIKAKIKNGKLISVVTSAKYYSDDLDNAVLENFLKLL